MKQAYNIFERNWFEVEERGTEDNALMLGTMRRNEKGVAGTYRRNLCDKCHMDDLDAGRDLICQEVAEVEDETLFAEQQISLCVPDSVIVGTQNVQSLSTRDAAEKILEKLRARLVDVLSLQELNIKSLADIAEFCSEVLDLGYSIVFCPQSSRTRTQGSSILIVSSALGLPEVHVAMDNDGVETILVSCERMGVAIDFLSLYAAPGKLQQTSFAVSDDLNGFTNPIIVLGDLNARSSDWDTSENKAGRIAKTWIGANNMGLGFKSEKTEWSDHSFTTCALKLKEVTREGFACDACEDLEDLAQAKQQEEFVQVFEYATNEEDYDEWHDAFRRQTDKNLWELGTKFWPLEDMNLEDKMARDDGDTCADVEEVQRELVKAQPGAGFVCGEVDMECGYPGEDVSAHLGGGDMETERSAPDDGCNGVKKKYGRADARWDDLDAKQTWKKINEIRGKAAWGTGFPEVMVSSDFEKRRKYLHRNVPGLTAAQTNTIEKVNKILKEKKVAAKPNLDERETDPDKIVSTITDYFKHKPFQAYKEMGAKPTPAAELNRKTDDLAEKVNERRKAEPGIISWPLTLLEFRAAVSGLETGRTCGHDKVSHEMMRALRGSTTELVLFKLFRILLARGAYPKAGRIIKIAPVGKLPVPVFLEMLMRP
eukprot:g19232.t1